MAAIPIPGVNTPTYQTWGAAVATKLNTFGFATFTGTTDSWGFLIIPASTFGLSVLTGGTASYGKDVGSATITREVTECFPQAGGANLLVRVVVVDTTANNIDPLASAAGITVNAFAWGT